MIPSREILEKQRAYFRTGATKPLSARKEALASLSNMLASQGDRIAEAIGEDLGRCWLEAWNSEPGLALADARYAIRHLHRWSRTRWLKPSPLMLPGSVRSIREPFGTAVIIAPWNYPAGLLLAPMVSALAAGNTVILKPSERALHTAAVLKSVIGKYFKEELATVVEADREEAGWLVRNAADIVCFTGSEATGKKVMADAAAGPVPVILELGGTNPCFVHKDADIKAASRRIAWGKFFAAGQTCMAPNHVFVHQDIYEDFLEAMSETVEDFYGKLPETSPDYSRIVDEMAWDRLQPMLSQGIPVCGGTGNREALYMAPTVLRNVAVDSPVLQQEIFGPILPVVSCDSIEKAVASFSERGSSPLAAYGFSRHSFSMEKLLRNSIRAGSITVNGTLHRIVSSSIGFGGVGSSGFNRYRGNEGYRNFTWERIVLIKNPKFEMPSLYPPYRIARRLVRMMARLI